MTCRRITARNRREAFTLVEVLLTLALIVVLAALTWPSVDRPMASQALRSAVDEVRTSWVRARVAAMNSGYTYKFLYAPGSGGDHYAVQCHDDPGTSGDGGVSGFGSVEGTVVEDARPPFAEDRHLPDRIRFAGGQSAVDSRAQVAASAGTTAADAELTWADPIFFYPDGQTSTACLRVQNRYGRMIELSLRGLTGVATVSPMQDAPPEPGIGN